MTDNTTFVHYANLDVLRRAVDEVMADDGRKRVPRPQTRSISADHEMIIGPAAACEVVALALFKGIRGWSAIKSAPLQMLGPGASTVRLMKICQALGCIGIQHHLYESGAQLIVEVDLQGRLSITGSLGAGSSESSVGPSRPVMSLLSLDEMLVGVGADDTLALTSLSPDATELDLGVEPRRVGRALHRALAGKRLDNLVSSGVLAPHRRLGIPGAKVLYYAWR